MHASGKVFMGIGLVLVVIGGVMLAWGADTASIDIEDDNEFEGTSGTWDAGDDWYGVYTKDSIDCDTLTVTILDENGSSSDEWGVEYWNHDCDLMDDEADPDGFQQVGSIALFSMYENKTFTITSSSKIYIVGGWGEVGEVAAGFLAGLGSLCFFGGGICLLLLGLVLGLTINDKTQTVVVQGGGGGMVGMGAPAVGAPGGAVPMMCAPVAVAQPMAAPVAAAPVAAAPVAAPNPAQEYYNGLLTQGYDAASAAQYTAQHYPGFQP